METNKDSNSILALLEALLFIYGEPLEIKKIAKILNKKNEEVEAGLRFLEEELAAEQRGLVLVRDEDRLQLATKPEFSKILEGITKQEFSEELTPASLETLSIIAYAGPILRADIEYIRGANSSFTLRALVMRGLVEREIDPKRGNAYLYRLSFESLRHLGLAKNSDLPEYQKYHDLTLRLHQELQKKDQAAVPAENDVNQPLIGDNASSKS